MDSQAIGPPTGVAPAHQTQARGQTTVPTKTGDATVEHMHADADADAKTVTKDEVRTRDPRSLKYQVDRNTQHVVATIVDDSNRTVIRQIPDEEILRIAKAIDRMQGFLLESKA